MQGVGWQMAADKGGGGQPRKVPLLWDGVERKG